MYLIDYIVTQISEKRLCKLLQAVHLFLRFVPLVCLVDPVRHCHHPVVAKRTNSLLCNLELYHFPLPHHSVDSFFFFFFILESLSPFELFWKSSTALAGARGVWSLAYYIAAREENVIKQVSEFRSFECYDNFPETKCAISGELEQNVQYQASYPVWRQVLFYILVNINMVWIVY